MFARLFAASGLSLDRLRALLEVSAAGNIAKAAEGDPVKQSQYSRQIKELEEFFRVKLTERHGKGIRLTSNGRELARIARFFLMGLSNFQRGCILEEQTFRVGADAAFTERFLIPCLASLQKEHDVRFVVEVVPAGEVERRLHDLTLDFGVVTSRTPGRPLRSEKLFDWRLDLWLPRTLCESERSALRAFAGKQLPLILAARDTEQLAISKLNDYEPVFVCDHFLQAAAALQHTGAATLLPDFLRSSVDSPMLRCVGDAAGVVWSYSLAWNPRSIRLNPRAARIREALVKKLSELPRRVGRNQTTRRRAGP